MEKIINAWKNFQSLVVEEIKATRNNADEEPTATHEKVGEIVKAMQQCIRDKWWILQILRLALERVIELEIDSHEDDEDVTYSLWDWYDK